MRCSIGYFGFCETPEVHLTRWVRLRLRAALWWQRKTPRRRRAALIALGLKGRLASNTAGSGLGRWHLAKIWHVLAKLLKPPPYAGWCGRAASRGAPYPDLL